MVQKLGAGHTHEKDREGYRAYAKDSLRSPQDISTHVIWPRLSDKRRSVTSAASVTAVAHWISQPRPQAAPFPEQVSSVAPDISDLVSRTAEEHCANGIDDRTRHEAVGIDVRKHVVVVATDEGEQLSLRQAADRDGSVRDGWNSQSTSAADRSDAGAGRTIAVSAGAG